MEVKLKSSLIPFSLREKVAAKPTDEGERSSQHSSSNKPALPHHRFAALLPLGKAWWL
jgi:hypothetical protein